MWFFKRSICLDLFRIIKLEVIYIIFLVNILFTYVKITSKRRLNEISFETSL